MSSSMGRILPYITWKIRKTCSKAPTKYEQRRESSSWIFYVLYCFMIPWILTGRGNLAGTTATAAKFPSLNSFITQSLSWSAQVSDGIPPKSPEVGIRKRGWRWLDVRSRIPQGLAPLVASHRVYTELGSHLSWRNMAIMAHGNFLGTIFRRCWQYPRVLVEIPIPRHWQNSLRSELLRLYGRDIFKNHRKHIVKVIVGIGRGYWKTSLCTWNNQHVIGKIL